MWRTGLVAPRHVGSSRTRARTRVPCIGRWILNHCATREVPSSPVFFLKKKKQRRFTMTFQNKVQPPWPVHHDVARNFPASLLATPCLDYTPLLLLHAPYTLLPVTSLLPVRRWSSATSSRNFHDLPPLPLLHARVLPECMSLMPSFQPEYSHLLDRVLLNKGAEVLSLSSGPCMVSDM